MTQYGTKAQQELASIRDTVQSIWVAIVLALVLRAFVVEAFVIPTGSMAPRLYGEHLDLECPSCGHEFAYGWSVSHQGGTTNGPRRPAGAICPTCGYDKCEKSHVAGGDRVLVMKYPYRFQQPKPWDVIVFKNPQDNRQNYIKRLIGLPGETIEIVHGDVFVRRDTNGFAIRRKDDPRVQKAMWQVVFDNDYRPDRDLIDRVNLERPLSERINPPRWDRDDPNDNRWNLAEDAASQYGRVFRFIGDSNSPAPAWLKLNANDRLFLPRYGYDSGDRKLERIDVVSDLKLEGTWQPTRSDSRLTLSLSSFEYVFTAHISGDGSVRLLCRSAGSEEPTRLAPDAKVASLVDGRGHVVSIRNVDMRASVWIDGRCVTQSADEAPVAGDAAIMKYPMDYQWITNRMRQARDTLDPKPIPQPRARIAANGSDSVFQHVKLMRDVYYTSPVLSGNNEDEVSLDFFHRLGVQRGSPGWGTEGNPITLQTFDDPDLNQYFTMGDNSPSSLDGRVWLAAAPTLRLYDRSGLRGDPNLKIGDITWKNLSLILRRRASGPESSIGAYIMSRLSPDVRQRLQGLRHMDLGDDVPSETVIQLRHKIVDELNKKMIAAPGFYNRKVWLNWGVTLSGAAEPLMQEQVAGKKLSKKKLARLNRLAIQAAMPKTVSDEWRIYQLGTVPQYSLIGKAIFVYWPSGFRVPGVSGLPIIPNVGRMRLIR